MTNAKHVFHVNDLADPVFADILAKRPEIVLERIDPRDAARTGRILTAAHVYQIGSASNELPAEFRETAAILARTPNLLVVSTNGAGFDTVDVDACNRAGVAVVNQAGGNREAVAEHVLSMMIALSKHIADSDKALRRETKMERQRYIGNDIYGKTIGIVGFGNVGRRVAEICRGAFAMTVLAFDPYLTAEQIAARGARPATLPDVMSQSDFVSIHCPLTDDTRNLIGRREFALMRPHAIFIQTARGGIHDEEALADALAAGKLAGAGLDVWAKEPPPPDHPLLKFDTVLASPHLAGVTREARINVARMAAHQVIDVLDGKAADRICNPDVWPHYSRRFEAIFGVRPQPLGTAASGTSWPY